MPGLRRCEPEQDEATDTLHCQLRGASGMFTRFARASSVVVSPAPAPCCVTPSRAAEVTLRMRGGHLRGEGKLTVTQFQVSYILAVPGIGNLPLDASRYECIGANCPSRSNAPIPPLPAGGAVKHLDRWKCGWDRGHAATGPRLCGLDRSHHHNVRWLGPRNSSSRYFPVRPPDWQSMPTGLAALRILALAKKEADLVWTGRRIGRKSNR